MPALTIDRLIQMNEYTLTKQNRWLVMGCILDFRKRCSRGRQSGYPAAAEPLKKYEWRFSEFDMWEFTVFEESKHGNFVESNRPIPWGEDSKQQQRARLLARTLYRAHILLNIPAPAIKLMTGYALAAVTGLIVGAVWAGWSWW